MEPDRVAALSARVAELSGTTADTSEYETLVEDLGDTGDPRAVPVLAGLATHSDPGVRLAVARALPDALGERTDDDGVAALVGLCRDPDPQVRDRAAFGLGFQTVADGTAVRRALWRCAQDEHPEVREEGVRGLARRRDGRVLPMLAELLAEPDAHVLTFDAAAFLGSPVLLPLLARYDPADPGVARALRECDPVRRARRDGFALDLFDAVCARLPQGGVALYGERYDVGLVLEVGDHPPGRRPGLSGRAPAADRILHWGVEGLLDRAGGDPDLAAGLVVADRGAGARQRASGW